jgi:hypothetical protein
VLTVIGLAIGAVVWIDSYQPLSTGNTSLGPLDSVDSPAGHGTYVTSTRASGSNGHDHLERWRPAADYAVAGR